jgi:hypothetical protein
MLEVAKYLLRQRERERQTDRQTDRETDREKESEEKECQEQNIFPSANVQQIKCLLDKKK